MEYIIPILEKAKENSIPFLLGCVISTVATYIVLDKLHEKQMVISQLESKVKNDRLEAELSLLKTDNERLRDGGNSAESLAQSRESISDIENLIGNLDKEIKIKKQQISMASSSRITRFSENEKTTSKKTELQIRLEHELEYLLKQRDLARKKQIEIYGVN